MLKRLKTPPKITIKRTLNQTNNHVLLRGNFSPPNPNYWWNMHAYERLAETKGMFGCYF